ncbi:MAG: HAMP domain-containing histidine kinase [Sedimentisphaerales bacterium]|nr:HAMP domain-containing histidine kinase [Sedimentisphaerales bacterium]
MYRRMFILSVILLAALLVLTGLGYYSLRILAEGLEGRRLGEFAAVAEQIRRDVKQKLDQFIQTEEDRPYTDYQYYYVPEDIASSQVQMPLLRSPLGNSLDQGMAYGYFQIEPDGSIMTPYYNDTITQTAQTERVLPQTQEYVNNIKENLLPRLNGVSSSLFNNYTEKDAVEDKNQTDSLAESPDNQAGPSRSYKASVDQSLKSSGTFSVQTQRSQSLPIESLQQQQARPRVITKSRANVEMNYASNEAMDNNMAQNEVGQTADAPGMMPSQSLFFQNEQSGEGIHSQVRPSEQTLRTPGMPGMPGMFGPEYQRADIDVSPHAAFGQSAAKQEERETSRRSLRASQQDTVQIRIEPFVPVLAAGQREGSGLFDNQVFLVRHIQIENRRLLQGFKLNENKLLEEVRESANRFIREGMSFDLSQTENPAAAYTAILDFGFGDLILNLKEIDPFRIGKQTSQLQYWFFSIIAVVFLAVTLGLVSLWRNLKEQVMLTRKKDDFISAVSHELRTPLTSIRMYTEMLEKNWIKSEDKRDEYYLTMRQESERLSRLIENVLDFSRIQRGKKQYDIKLGDMNQCVERVVDMMMPYTQKSGFTLEKDFSPIKQFAFDSDAVMQIVINLIDNAVKYGRDSQDDKIIVRTRQEGIYALIEVEDHGPGIPHHQQKKVFDEFYRCEDESRRETTGVGLGLALVRKFADAHKGFVEILCATPRGAILRVALAAQT